MPKAIKKAAIYCRVSTLHQIDKDSLPMQRNDMINYAKYALNIEDYEVFEDAGYSGKNMDRPAFQAMMERVHDGEFTHILVWKIDRISRNLLDFANMYEQCKKLGVTFISKNEQFDTSTAMGEAMLKIILVFAELERNMTSERVSATMNARAADGKWNGGRVPYAYNYDKKTDTFSFRNDEKQVALLLKDIDLQEHSLVKTAAALNDAGHRTRRGYQWTPTTVAIILRSPFYRGTMRYNYRDESENSFSFKDQKEWILIHKHHPLLFSAEDCQKLDFWLTKNRRMHGKGSHTQRKNVHVFAGLIHCGNCGSLMIATVSRTRPDGYRPSMYICGERRLNHKCTNKYTTDIMVGSFVFNYVSNMIQLRRCFQPVMQNHDLEKILLQGSPFENVTAISPATLTDLRHTLTESAIDTVDYTPLENRAERELSDSHAKRYTQLQSEITKRRRALERLEALYLYAEDSMPQKDYLIKRRALTADLEKFTRESEQLQKDSIFLTSIADEKFLEKAARLIFKESLIAGGVKFQELVMNSGNKILKDFVNSIIKNIIVLDGHVTQIEFVNSAIHTFHY